MKCHRCRDYNNRTQECECIVPGCTGHEHYLPTTKWAIIELIVLAVIVFGIIAWVLRFKEAGELNLW